MVLDKTAPVADWSLEIPEEPRLDRNSTQEVLHGLFTIFYKEKKGERLPSGDESWLYSVLDAKTIRNPEQTISSESNPDVTISIKPHTKRMARTLVLTKHYDLQIQWGSDQPWRSYTFMLDGEYRPSHVGGKSDLLPMAGNKLVLQKGLAQVSDSDHAKALFLEFHPKNANAPMYWPEDEQENRWGVKMKVSSRDKASTPTFSRPVVAIQSRIDLDAAVARVSVAQAIRGVADIGTLRAACAHFNLKIPADAVGQAHYMLGIVNDYAIGHPQEVLRFLFGDSGDILRMINLALSRKLIEVDEVGTVTTHTGLTWFWVKVPLNEPDHGAYIARQVVEQGEFQLFTALKKELAKWGQGGETIGETIVMVDSLISEDRIVYNAKFKWETGDGEKIIGVSTKSTESERLDVLYKFADENPQDFRRLVGMGYDQP